MRTIAAKQQELRHSVSRPDPVELDFQQLKVAIHEVLVESLNLSTGDITNEAGFADELRGLGKELCDLKASHYPTEKRERLLSELMDEVFGLGPLERLVNDPEVTDILVNSPFEVHVERHGQLELTDVIFADNDHILRTVQRIAARVGRRVDETSPMVDARLEDGSRINAVIPPLAIDGPLLSIRRFSAEPLRLDTMIDNGSLSSDMADFLIGAVDAGMSFLISGGTGAGKTTLLNALSEFISDGERVVTIEDSAELQLQNRHVVRLETRTNNTEGVGAVDQRNLVRNALRMRPDRIMVGEVRGAEALDMLQAMNSGHEGSLSTIHANDTREALARLEMMAAMAGFNLPVPVVRQYIAAGIRLIVHVARLKNGERKVVRISEIAGVEDGEFIVQDVFRFERDEITTTTGAFRSTGYLPRCRTRMKAAGVNVSDWWFSNSSQPVE
ncbi:MAG: CpaF family protein [Rhodopirellula sp.]|nr:CpaF family protein [Rhodopirellula sp.]